MSEGADRPPAAVGLTPLLRLDELIDRLIDHAQDVRRAEDRLRALLEATDLITSDLSLENVLVHIAEAARTVADARYAALGVIAADGGLERFIHSGIDDEVARAIGPLPQGKGLLGALIRDPRPIRLENLADDPRSVGFPPNHPPMRSFLGVPVVVRDEVFGNLYLTESRNGAFSEEDESLVASLARAAATAISNARLYQEARVKQRWLSASVDIGSQLLASEGEDPLRMVARYASDIADADLASVGVITADGQDIFVEVAIGERADELIGQRFPLEGSLARRAVTTRSPLLIRSPDDAAGDVPVMTTLIEAGPIMVIPLLGTEKVHGVLNIVRRRGSATFAPSDLDMAAGFANQASVAIEIAASRSDQQRIALLEDRDRIARDLHDHVIQQLFAIGLNLQGLAVLAADDSRLATALRGRVEDLDRTIRQIRTSIFALRGPLAGSAGGLRSAVLAVAEELRPALGRPAGVTFDGPVDSLVVDTLADDVIACVREGLTNVARHADARHVQVDVAADATHVTVRIADDGRGIDDRATHSGLSNLRARAEHRGGTFEIQVPAAGGTELIWRVPLS
ncbi:MAG: GAF domain-containing protein [Jatrophihabitans sp.]|nr:MAG: GAF domain-containing protein [Jatrophihabitans sp.]